MRASASAPVAMAARAARSAASIPGSVVGPGTARSRASSGRAPSSSSRTARASSRNSASESWSGVHAGSRSGTSSPPRRAISACSISVAPAGPPAGARASASSAESFSTLRSEVDTVVPERTRMRTRLAGPSRLPAHASSAGSTFARTWVASVGQPVPAGASASTSRRCVTAVPERGVRTTCTSGAWASPRESASTVAPARCALPCTAWWTLSAMSRSASASTASSSARSSASTAWPSGVVRTGRPALPNGIVVSSHTFAASPARQRRRSPRPSATLLARSASDTRGSCARRSSTCAWAAVTAALAASTASCWSPTCCSSAATCAAAACCCGAQRRRFVVGGDDRGVRRGDPRLRARRSSPASRARRRARSGSPGSRRAGAPAAHSSGPAPPAAALLSDAALACAASSADCAVSDLRPAAPCRSPWPASSCACS